MNNGHGTIADLIVSFLNDEKSKVEFQVNGTGEEQCSVKAEIPKDIIPKLKPGLAIRWDMSFVYLNILGVDVPFTKIGFSKQAQK